MQLSGDDSIVRVSERGFERLWGNEGQARVTRAQGVRRSGAAVHMIAKRANVPAPRGRKRKHGDSGGDESDLTAMWKARVKVRSFVAEEAFLRLLAQPWGEGEPETLHARLCRLDATVPLLYYARSAVPPAVAALAVPGGGGAGGGGGRGGGGGGGGGGGAESGGQQDASFGDAGADNDAPGRLDGRLDLSGVPPLLWRRRTACPAQFDFLLEDLEHRCAGVDSGGVTPTAAVAAADDDGGGDGGAAAPRECAWQEYTLATETHARAAVRWLAGFHACFEGLGQGGCAAAAATPGTGGAGGGGSGVVAAAAGVPAGAWVQGTYWSLAKRRQDWDPLRAAAAWEQAWAGGAAGEAAQARLLGLRGLRQLAARLSACAASLDRYVNHPSPESPRYARRTLVHGDFKAENCFFFFSRRSSPPSSSPPAVRAPAALAAAAADTELRCSACDFQWVGGGQGVVDLVYLLATSVEDRAAHPALVRYYHEQMQRLRAGGGLAHLAPATTPALADTEREYGMALLDFARFCVMDPAGVVWEDDGWMLEEANRLLCEVDGGECLSPSEYEARLLRRT